MEKKIRKEIKYSNEEWNKVVELSAKSGKLPAAYIRDQALNIKIKVIEDLGIIDALGTRNKFYWGMNDIAKRVNIEKRVYAVDVEDVETMINFVRDFSQNGLRGIVMREVNI